MCVCVWRRVVTGKEGGAMVPSPSKLTRCMRAIRGVATRTAARSGGAGRTRDDVRAPRAQGGRRGPRQQMDDCTDTDRAKTSLRLCRCAFRAVRCGGSGRTGRRRTSRDLTGKRNWELGWLLRFWSSCRRLQLATAAESPEPGDAAYSLLGQQSVACGRAGMVMRIHDDHMYGHHDHAASFGEA